MTLGIFDEPLPPPPKDDNDGWPRYAAFTVAIAALSTLTSALATWGVDELRARYGSKEAARIRVAGGDGADGTREDAR